MKLSTIRADYEGRTDEDIILDLFTALRCARSQRDIMAAKLAAIREENRKIRHSLQLLSGHVKLANEEIKNIEFTTPKEEPVLSKIQW